VYLPSIWLLISFLNPVEATTDVDDGDYEDTEMKRRHRRAMVIILGYTVMTMCFFICIYLRNQICRQRNETAEAPVQPNEHSITTATRKLDIRVIESFPEIIFPPTDAKFHFTDCHICLEEFKQGESLVGLPTCGHAYHKECIHRWMATRNSCCPDCRHDYGFV
ncbi:hypothetical protein C2S52_006929, partial [Perilla frutescens var. hirtella]